MALTTTKFREDFELGCRTGIPSLDASPSLMAAVLMAHAAFVQPERQIGIFDAIADAWLDLDSGADRMAPLRQQLSWLRAPAVIQEWQTPRAVWDAFWGVVDAEPAAPASCRRQRCRARLYRPSRRHRHALRRRVIDALRTGPLPA